MKSHFSKFSRAALALTTLAFSAGRGQAQQVTFSFTFSEGSATAIGDITFADLSFINNTDNNSFVIGGPELLSINLTVSGASSGNGTFTAADFSSVTFWAPYVLDFGQELVGQTPAGQPNFWGFPGVINVQGGDDGDFNLLSASAGAPNGVWYFTLGADNDNADFMILRSMIMVPEPSTYAAFAGLLAGSLAIYRRRQQRKVLA